jgi:hypothetical protein
MLRGAERDAGAQEIGGGEEGKRALGGYLLSGLNH